MAEAKKKPEKTEKPEKDRGDPHARIDRLEELMRQNGWTV